MIRLLVCVPANSFAFGDPALWHKYIWAFHHLHYQRLADYYCNLNQRQVHKARTADTILVQLSLVLMSTRVSSCRNDGNDSVEKKNAPWYLCITYWQHILLWPCLHDCGNIAPSNRLPWDTRPIILTTKICSRATSIVNSLARMVMLTEAWMRGAY